MAFLPRIIHSLIFRPVDNVYGGDYPELFSVAISSVLGMRGVDFHWPDIIILDEDDHGRIIFEYSEGDLYRSRLVMQKVQDGYAYFYPHYNLGRAFPRGLPRRNVFEELCSA